MRLPAPPPAVRAQEFDVGGSSFAPPPPGATSPEAHQLITRVRMGHVLRHSEMVMLRAARLVGDSKTADAQRVYLAQLRSARGPLGGNFQHALKGYSPQHAVAETRAALRAGSPLLAHQRSVPTLGRWDAALDAGADFAAAGGGPHFPASARRRPPGAQTARLRRPTHREGAAHEHPSPMLVVGAVGSRAGHRLAGASVPVRLPATALGRLSAHSSSAPEFEVATPSFDEIGRLLPRTRGSR